MNYWDAVIVSLCITALCMILHLIMSHSEREE